MSTQTEPPVQVSNAPPPTVDMPRPLPVKTTPTDAGPGFDDPAILHQQLPEAPAFVDAYNKVGKPRLMVFVNRTLTGQPTLHAPPAPDLVIQNTQQATGSVQTSSTSNDYNYYSGYADTSRSFESNGPGTYTSKTEIYLPPGQDSQPASTVFDHATIESLITDQLATSGKVVMISPTAARQQLTDQEFKDLQSGRPQMLGELTQQLQCDVLIQVTAGPSQQTSQGPGIRLIAQAFNTRGGQAIANAAVDIPPPLTKAQLNVFSRFITRKLMDGMTQSWNTMVLMAPLPSPPAKPADALPPGTRATPLVPPPAAPATLPDTPDEIFDITAQLFNRICRSTLMIRSALFAALLFSILPLAGCATDLSPATARSDKYIADHVVFSGQDDLVDHIAFGNITRSFDNAGLLHVVIPARATTPDDLYVDYRLTYFDENHNPIDLPTAWQTQTLHSNIFQYLQANSTTPRAHDFQIDFRSAQ